MNGVRLSRAVGFRRMCWSALLLGALSGCNDETSICTAGGASAADYQLSPSGEVVAVVDPVLFDKVFDWQDSGTPAGSQNFECLVNYFTQRYSNDVDMLLVVLNISRADFLERSTRRVVSNFTVTQRVFDSGIGLQSIPLSSQVGGAALRSFSFFGVREGIEAGPALHELAHNWAAYLDGPESLLAQVSASPVAHWGFTSVGGALGGWDPQTLEPLAVDRFRVCSPSPFERFSPAGYANDNIPYAPLELYLMGLIPADEVPPIEVAINPVVSSSDGQCSEIYADGMETVTIDEIVADNGARVPAAEEAPTQFQLGVMLISDHYLDEQEWQYYEEALLCLEASGSCGRLVEGVTSIAGQQPIFIPLSFYEATGGRAELQFEQLEELPSSESTNSTDSGTLKQSRRRGSGEWQVVECPLNEQPADDGGESCSAG
ncbi:MAG: hypothetical protein HJJLKODD_00953 [Phycisphaerae bacterium]|nr:hypothetical protein [Phycisphaerae bacterium]